MLKSFQIHGNNCSSGDAGRVRVLVNGEAAAWETCACPSAALGNLGLCWQSSLLPKVLIPSSSRQEALLLFYLGRGKWIWSSSHLLPLMNSDVDFSKEPLIPKKAALALKGKPHISDQYLNFQVTHFNFILSLLFFFIFYGVYLQWKLACILM